MPTVAEYVLQGTVRLTFGAHKDRARADAELLLRHLLQKDRTWLITHAGDEIGSDHWEAYFALLERRYRGEPIQYLLGEAEFYGLRFRVTPDVLIPRPETEHLVEQAITLAAEFAEPRIVDVGAGSGAIAVALSVSLVNARITSIDVSPDALAIARENAVRNRVTERIRFLGGDLLESVAGEQFDLVVSNPPYVPKADRASLSVEVREYEPAQALFAGEDGLDVYRRLIPAAHAVLAPDGYILLEIGYGQPEGVRALLAGGGFEAIHFVPDLQGIPRVACAKR